MDPSLVMGTNLWLEILNGPQLGDFEGVLVGNCNDEVLRQSYGFLVGRSAKVCLSVHQTGPGSGVVWIFVLWCDWWMTGCLEVPEPKLCTHFDPDARVEG